MWVLTPILPIRSTMPAKVESTPALPGVSPVGGKAVIARFDGGHLSSDGGVLVLREVERRLDVAGRLAAGIADPRHPERVVHGLDEIVRFRMLMIAAGYEDGNDADRLRTDPMFKLALERLGSDAALCSPSTISRLENLPGPRPPLRMGQAMIDLYCASFRQVPSRIVLDVDDTFDAVHGEQQLRLFNAHYDEYGFQPIVVFDGEGRFVAAMLRPAKRPKGCEIRAFLRRLVRQIQANWPRVRILIRADSHYCGPEVLSWCRANGSTTCSASRPPARCGAGSSTCRPAPSRAMPRPAAPPSCAASPSSTMPPRVGRGSSASSLGSRRGRTAWIRASSSPACPAAQPAPSMSGATVSAARLKTTSRVGNAISPPTAPRAPGQPPTRCACSCTPGLTG